MSSGNPDVIVIGAGMAGLCCAGELVLEGMRPLLISETKEVGAAMSSIMVDGNRGFMQTPTWQAAWGGGWWPSLVRRLNIPVVVPAGFGPLHYSLILRGSDKKPVLPQCALSASAVADALLEIFPPYVHLKPELIRVLVDALAIPYPELNRMHRIRLVDWLEERNTDETVVQLMLALASSLTYMSADLCRDHMSVYSTFGYLRSFFCGEASYGMPFPDIREGLLIPIANEIERRGGTIWRGRKVARVNIDGGRVGSVVMADGAEVRAPIVAIATADGRISSLLNPLPAEVEAAVTYTAQLEHRNFNIFTVLDRPVVPADSTAWVGVCIPETGSMLYWIHNLHVDAPWTTQPGKQFLTSGMILRPEKVTEYGSEEAIYAHLHDLVEECYPGYKQARGATKTLTRPSSHLWFGNCSVGPKIPRTIDSVKGLWFVGEGSEPTFGTYMEAVASAGMHGARSMAEVLRTSR